MRRQKMEKDPKIHGASGGFSSGFLLGAIVGGILVFLIATKKGKKILKILTENGFEGIGDLVDMFEDEEIDEMEEEEYTAEGEVVHHPRKYQSSSVLRPVKRFFKRKK